MPREDLRFGIIGAGMIADYHAKAMEAVDGVGLAGFCSTTPASREALAAKHGARAYDSMEEMLADPDINAVAIATPSGLHGEQGIAAARAGKHVLCEKPLEITPARAQTMIDICRDAGVILAPIFPLRYAAGSRLVREALAKGRFGKALFASARIKWFRPQSYYESAPWRGTSDLDGGGCLMNQGIHAVDLMLSFGGVPAEVYGSCTTATHDIAVEDNAVAMVRFESGALGTIEASTSCEPGFPNEIAVSGDRGTAVVTGDHVIQWSFKDEDPLDGKVQVEPVSFGNGASDPRGISIHGHVAVIQGMLKAVRGDASELIDPVEARYSLDVICGIYESQKTKRAVALPWKA